MPVWLRKGLRTGVWLGVLGLHALACTATGAAAPTSPGETRPATPATASPSSTTSAPPVKRMVSMGYYTGDRKSYEAVIQFSEFLTAVSVDVFVVRPDGSISGRDGYDVMESARALGLEVYACINNYNSDPSVDGFDPALAHAAIVTNRDQTLAAILALAKGGRFDGVNIDFENLTGFPDPEENRAAFTEFIRLLAPRLHAGGLKLVISVPGKDADSPDNIWSYPFDLAALGREADYLQLMTYDQHGPWSDPGPVSGADWVESCLAYTASVVDPAKLLIGLPAYGYDWDLTESNLEEDVYSAKGFSWTDTATRTGLPGAVLRWDTVSLSPSLTYELDGHRHEAWFENPESIRAKARLIAQYKLAGLSMWSLGQEDRAFWEAAIGDALAPAFTLHAPLGFAR